MDLRRQQVRRHVSIFLQRLRVLQVPLLLQTGRERQGYDREEDKPLHQGLLVRHLACDHLCEFVSICSRVQNCKTMLFRASGCSTWWITKSPRTTRTLITFPPGPSLWVGAWRPPHWRQYRFARSGPSIEPEGRIWARYTRNCCLNYFLLLFSVARGNVVAVIYCVTNTYFTQTS